jgi:hypothetical protein
VSVPTDTDRPATLDEALERHDVTIALTPGQLLLLAIALIVLLRGLRRLRS